MLLLFVGLFPSAACAGFFDDLFGGAPQQQAEPAPRAHLPRVTTHHYAPFDDLVDPGKGSRRKRQASLSSDRRLTGGVTLGEPKLRGQRGARPAIVDAVSGTDIGKFVCVRLCDGAVISLARHNSGGAQPSCDTACPGAEARLYTLRAAGDDIGSAVDPVTKSSYADLVARVKASDEKKACACGSVVFDADVDVDDFLADATLRDGDVVATSEGLHVFRGQRRLPHRMNEFLALQDARGRSARAAQSELRAIDQALKTAKSDSDIAAAQKPSE